MKKYIGGALMTLFLFSGSLNLQAQESLAIDYSTPTKKGKMYVYWGWNVSSYSNSDITFKGDSYDFKLSDVEAKDRQTDFDPSIYFNPVLFTIPQYNFKIGYFISDHYAISGGVDHMKYVMVQGQTVKIDGTISEPNPAEYVKSYSDEDILLTEDFLTFEHTDGLNYINFAIERYDDILKIIGDGKKNLELNTVLGAGAGLLLPKTNAKLMANDRQDDFHIAGYGLDVKVGLNITFYKYFFVQGELKGGFIHMPDIRTTQFKADKASQAFFFGEASFMFGAIFRISNK